jgi:hypothetical protein
MITLTENVLVFKTDIDDDHQWNTIKKNLELHLPISSCSLDFEDVDRVLRVIGSEIEPFEVKTIIEQQGKTCSELT